MDPWTHDLRFAARKLVKAPLFAAVAVTTLALGIGVNATLFTFVDAVLLAPPPIEKPDEVVAIFSSWDEEPWATSSYLDYRDLREHSDGVLSGLCGYSMAFAGLQRDGTSDMIVGELVTGEYFEVLGVDVDRGRGFTIADDAPGAPRTVVLGHDLWQRRFGGDPGILGQAVRLSGSTYEVVGVAGEDFPGLVPGIVSDFWLPMIRLGDVEPAGQIHSVAEDPGTTRLERRGYRYMWLRGRLADGVAPATAGARLATLADALAAEHPITNEGVGARLRPLREIRLHPDIDGPLRAAAAVVMGAVGSVLLVVCANLASLLLARAQTRRSEIAVRLALGASRARLVRQLVTESLVLAAAGGALALVLAEWTSRLLLAFQPPIPFSIQLAIDVDSRVVLFVALLAFGSALVFALVPALQSTRPDLVPALKGAASADAGAPRRFGLRSALVVAQVAVSTLLLVVAAFLLRALDRAQAIDIGLDAERVAVLSMQLDLLGYEDDDAERFLQNLKARATEVPGVERVALASRVPFDINFHNQSIFPDSQNLDAEHPGFRIDVGWVDPEYFTALGIAKIAGRDFTAADGPDTPRVAIVNQAMARRFWSDNEAVGQTFRVGRLGSQPVEIVGVVADAKVRTVGEAPRPMIHFARPQRPAPGAHLVARAEEGVEAASLLPGLRAAAFELDSAMAFADSTTLDQRMAVSLFPVRAGALLLSLFAFLALVLASLGLYGVIALSVAQRRREIGMRVALGARPRDIVQNVLGGGAVLVGLGALLGVIGAALLGQRLSSALYGTSGLDPLAFGAALVTLGLVALAANAVPAIRATRVDVVDALGDE